LSRGARGRPADDRRQASAGEEFKRGYWLEPTVFADVNPSMRIAREEIFGPVLSVFSWRDEKEALTLANSTNTA